MMQNRIHTFRAATMEEALELVHRELGKDYVIVESREIPKRRLVPWANVKPEIEVSAEPSLHREPPQITYAANKSASHQRAVRTLAETMTAPVELPVAPLFSTIPALPSDSAEPVAPISQPIPSAPAPSVATGLTESIASLFSQSPEDAPATLDAKNLELLQRLVVQLEHQSQPQGNIPDDLFQYYHQLTVEDVEDDVARNLIAKLNRQAPQETRQSPVAMSALLTTLIEREMRCAPPIQPRPGQREVVMLIGPTGAGKTTTIAKLAGHYVINEGLRVGLITTDTYRVGAVDQLQSYAEILQLPFAAVSSADELRNAIDQMGDLDLVLIDTAGQNPFDESKMAQLKQMIEISGSDHVLLVLSMAASSKMNSRIASQFSTVAPTSLILTKLDEQPNAGGLLSLAREVALPVSYLTIGQEVPSQIEPAHPSRMARLVLGRDALHPPEPRSFEFM